MRVPQQRAGVSQERCGRVWEACVCGPPPPLPGLGAELAVVPEGPRRGRKKDPGNKTQRTNKYMKGCARFPSVCRPGEGQKPGRGREATASPAALPGAQPFAFVAAPRPQGAAPGPRLRLEPALRLALLRGERPPQRGEGQTPWGSGYRKGTLRARRPHLPTCRARPGRVASRLCCACPGSAEPPARRRPPVRPPPLRPPRRAAARPWLSPSPRQRRARGGTGGVTAAAQRPRGPARRAPGGWGGSG